MQLLWYKNPPQSKSKPTTTEFLRSLDQNELWRYIYVVLKFNFKYNQLTMYISTTSRCRRRRRRGRLLQILYKSIFVIAMANLMVFGRKVGFENQNLFAKF